MGPSRCTMKVEGLDCPVETDALRDALDGAAGVDRLDFDLIHGTMTVHYRDAESSPPELLRRVATRTGMKASLLASAEPRSSRLERLGRWTPTAGAGAALLAGLVSSW